MTRPEDDPVECRGGYPRTHGSGLFNRGETRGEHRDVGDRVGRADVESLSGDVQELYAPLQLSAVRRASLSPQPRRRGIGHGALAEKALVPVLPGETSPVHDSRRL